MKCRRYPSFSLRALFVLTTALAVWFGAVVHRARKQREGVAAIEAAGGNVAYSYYALPGGYYSTRQPAGADWLRSALGDEYFQSVTFVDLREAKIGDDLFERMGGLTTIDTLLLANPDVGDRELAYLAGLSRLEFLSLLGRRDPEPQISPAGLEHLRQLPGLGVLHLPECPISDAGLAIIAEIKSLQGLIFSDPQITDAGLEHLTSLPGLTDLAIESASVSDHGLEHLGKLKKLQTLTVVTTTPEKITDAGLAHLAALTELESLYILEGDLTDAGLLSLEGLSKLRQVTIVNCRTTRQGEKELEQTIPGCIVATGRRE